MGNNSPENLHAGHRQRIKNRFLNEGLDGFEPYQVLELLLFYAVPRMDTNPVAHRLLSRFGYLDAVFDAPIEELIKIEGVGENAATLIKMIPAISRSYHMWKAKLNPIADTSEKTGEFLRPYFIGRNNEAVVLLCLDGMMRIIGCTVICEGSVNTVNVDLRRLTETALRFGAINIVIAHNHPRNMALPSDKDIKTTMDIRAALEPLNIRLYDHLIFADGNSGENIYGDYVSFRDSGLL